MPPFVQQISLKKQEDASYFWHIPAVRYFQPLTLKQPITFFIGENGTGKSTLMEAIACQAGINPEGGSRNFLFSTKDSHSSLGDYMVLGKTGNKIRDTFFLRAESFYNVASYIEETMDGNYSEYGNRSLHEQSHGESFLSLVSNRFRGHGLYLLDEPEAALSPQRMLSLMVLLHDLVENGSQFIITTHSPILLAMPQAQIFSFQENGIQEVAYEDTEVFQLTKMFINHKDQVLHHLFDE